MDELKIGKGLEENAEKEQKKEIESIVKEDLNSDFNLKSDSRGIIIMVIILAGIFVFFIGGFKAYDYFTSAGVITIDDLHKENLAGELDGEEGYLYNGFSFVKVDGLWWTEVKLGARTVKIPLHFSPKEVEEIKTEGQLKPEFYDGDVYIAVNPNINQNKYYTLALMELNNNIVQGTDRGIITACTEENPICENRTIVNCEDAKGLPVIELAVEEEVGIELMGTCVKIKGDNYDLVKAANRLLYQWYGVMN